MRGTGSGGIGFVISSGTLLVAGVVLLALIALGAWFL